MTNTSEHPALWAWPDLIAATGATLDGTSRGIIHGVSIDTRTLQPGDLFVALRDARDGHEFVSAAFAAGAAAALVLEGYERQPGDGTLLRCDDPLRALERLAVAARTRLAPEARVVAITGSAGKTGSKEMLRAALSTVGKTHASEKSYNNHWGVPLTLARMPADTRFAVLEIGMNHPGEITPLTRLVRPHAAMITNVLPVHLGQFTGEEAIADAKAEIFAGLEPPPGAERAVAVLPRDNPHFERLALTARAAGARIVSFGRGENTDARGHETTLGASGTAITVALDDRRVTFELPVPGDHVAANAIGVVALLDVIGVDASRAVAGLATLGGAPAGRGMRVVLAEPTAGRRGVLLVDESYNANPASMAAALATLALMPRGQYPRRIAVLGQMLELGPRSAEFHLALKQPIDAAGIDLVFACGPEMKPLLEGLPAGGRGVWASRSEELIGPLLAEVRAGDVVMVKGSLGTRMAPLVQALRQHFSIAIGRVESRREPS